MISFVKKYKQPVLFGCLVFLVGISGIVTMAADFEFTGIMFFILAISIVVYTLYLSYYKRSRHSPSSKYENLKDVRIFLFSFSTICIGGIIESYQANSDYIGIPIILLIGASIFSFFYFRKKSIDFFFYIIYIEIGVVLLFVNDAFSDNEGLAIIAFCYFLLTIFLSARWVFQQIKSIIRLKNEKTKTELLHLKSQVNPHFFFNMLNNLYGLVGTDPKKAQELILKLSDLMRYGIYEGQNDLVSISQEIDYLKNYIELHKMRYRKEIQVTFETDILQEEQKVMPLLFIILLENAFKHGVENLREGAFVNIKIKANKSDIKFEVENNFDPLEESKPDGIGLENLKRRLELVYPKKHSLSFSILGDVYKATLTIEHL